MSGLPTRNEFFIGGLVHCPEVTDDCCAICNLDGEGDLFSLVSCACRIFYHHACISRWLEDENTAPCCRQAIFFLPLTVNDVMDGPLCPMQNFDIPMTLAWEQAAVAFDLRRRAREQETGVDMLDADMSDQGYVNLGIIAHNIIFIGRYRIATAMVDGNPYSQERLDELTVLLGALYRAVRRYRGRTMPLRDLRSRLFVYTGLRLARNAPAFEQVIEAAWGTSPRAAAQDLTHVMNWTMSVTWALGVDVEARRENEALSADRDETMADDTTNDVEIDDIDADDVDLDQVEEFLAR